MIRRIVIAGLLFFSASRGYSQLFINEILIANASVNYDREYFNYSSWVELYNSGTSPINLNSFYLTDNRKKLSKWQFPNVSIAAKGYTIVWIDKMNSGLHTNFGLDVNGEFLGLYNSSGQPVDSFDFPPQHPNISYARTPDGAATWGYLGKPTPGIANGTVASAYTPNPVFSVRGGFYSSAQSIALSSTSGTAKIYYTLDGSEPGDTSVQYTVPLNISSNKVLRAKAYDNGFLPSDIITQSYFINDSSKVAVVSVTIPPKYLWDDSIGIYVVGVNGVQNGSSGSYANYYRDWERAANVEFFNTMADTAGINTYCGIEIFGSASRGHAQKSLDVKIKDKYGRNKAVYKLFPNRDYNNIHSFIIRNSGNDWSDNNNSAGVMFKDGLIQTIPQGQMDVDLMAYRPAIVFLNGQYWGITDFREKLDKYYTNNNFPLVDMDSIDMIKQFWMGNAKYELVEGDTILMQKFFTFIKSNSMSDAANYQKVKDSLDVREFINYIVVETFSNNIDWPVNNIKLWRQQGITKWRWMIYDTDMGFGGFFPNAPPVWYPNRSNKIQGAFTADTATSNENMGKWTSIVMGSLMKNINFKNEFAQTYAAHMNSTYIQSRLTKITDSLKNMLQPEMQRHIDKWGASGSVKSMANWNKNLTETADFITERYPLIWTQLKAIVGMSNMAPVRISRKSGYMGMIYAQGATMYDSIMKGSYFNNIPLELNAVPKPGYVFNWWEKKKGGVITYLKPALISDVLNSSGATDSIFYTARFTKTAIDSVILTVNGGNGSGLYASTQVVPVSAIPSVAKKDKYFVKWTGDVSVMADENDSATTVTMPNTDVAVTAVFSHLLTVNGGTGSGIYAPSAVVNVKAKPPTFGKTFDKWTGDVTGLANIYDSVTAISMPSLETRITATYKISLGITAYNTGKFTISPNPATDHIEIIFSEKEDGTLTLMDYTGRVVRSQQINTDRIQMQVDALTPGVYMLVLKNGNGMATEKFIKE